MTPRGCSHCGGALPPPASTGRPRIYCSERCQRIAVGRRFYQRNRERLVESAKARYAPRPRRQGPVERPCVRCGSPMLTRGSRARCDACARSLDTDKVMTRRHLKARMGPLDKDTIALMKAAVEECPVCGVEMTNDSHVRTSKELDHFPVPLALGGAHTRENARIICKSCNSKLGNALQREMAATG